MFDCKANDIKITGYFIFYILLSSSRQAELLSHLSVIKVCALTIWIVVNSSARHNRQSTCVKLHLILTFPTLHLPITNLRIYSLPSLCG